VKGGAKEPEELKYLVSIEDGPVRKEIRKQAEIDSTLLEMTSSEGEKYDCFIPHPPNPDNEGSESAHIPTPEEIDSILAEMGTYSSCLFKLTGWWTYEFCYHKHFQQFHQPREGPIQQQYILGSYKEGSPPGQINNLNVDHSPSSDLEASLPYYSESYSDGTLCDLTGEPRTTEIRYYCNTEKVNLLKDIQEPSSCNYVVSIHTFLMCHFTAFKPKQSTVLSVQCFPQENSI